MGRINGGLTLGYAKQLSILYAGNIYIRNGEGDILAAKQFAKLHGSGQILRLLHSKRNGLTSVEGKAHRPGQEALHMLVIAQRFIIGHRIAGKVGDRDLLRHLRGEGDIAVALQHPGRDVQQDVKASALADTQRFDLIQIEDPLGCGIFLIKVIGTGQADKQLFTACRGGVADVGQHAGQVEAVLGLVAAHAGERIVSPELQRLGAIYRPVAVTIFRCLDLQVCALRRKWNRPLEAEGFSGVGPQAGVLIQTVNLLLPLAGDLIDVHMVALGRRQTVVGNFKLHGDRLPGLRQLGRHKRAFLCVLRSGLQEREIPGLDRAAGLQRSSNQTHIGNRQRVFCILG